MDKEQRKAEIDPIVNLLKRFDSDTILAAIKLADADYSKVDEIKSFLSKYSHTAIECALEEMKTESMNSEIRKLDEVIAKYGIEAVKEAAAGIGVGDRLALCIDTINCRSNCVMVMIVRCQQEMVALTRRWDMVQEDQLERGIARANAMAAKMGEI